MTLLPVIERELRAEARNSYHHWLRLTSTTAVLIYFYLIAQGYERPAPWLGRRLFQALAQSSVLMALVVTPLLTADCLSREKREGTLRLLYSSFLTLPLLGFCLSLTRLNLTAAFLLSLIVGVVLPQFLGELLTGYVRLFGGRRVWNVLVWFSFLQLGLGAISAFYLHTMLAQRRFLSK